MAGSQPFKFSLKPRDREQYIRNSLLMAKDSRAHMFMDFFLHERVLFQLKGACQDVEGDRIYIYLRDKLDYLPAKGMQVHVYYSLRHNHKPLPCDFTTTLLDTEKHNMDDFLVLQMPKEMSHHQRRYNVRISVKKEDIEDFRIWFGKPGKLQPDGKRGKQEWVPIEPEFIDIYDISAGGMQIGISRKWPLHPLISGQSVFLISGSFLIKNKEATPLIMAGNVVRLEDDPHQPYSVLGISYKQWAKTGQGGMQWIGMTVQDGVSPLASWVFQAIMERYKLDRDGSQPVDF